MIYPRLPYLIKIELTFGCNRLCDFCGLNSVWRTKEDRRLAFMSVETARVLGDDFKEWFGKRKIEFSLRGEPAINPALFEIISIFRESCPSGQLLMYSNGIIFRKRGKNFVKELFKAGVNVVILDTYEHREESILVARASGIQTIDYYEDKSFNPYYNHGEKTKIIVVMDDIGKRNKERVTRTLSNVAGNISPEAAAKYNIQLLAAPLPKMCGRPFKEIVIHYDGVVPICCVDWKEECILGKFPEDGGVRDIWNAEAFNAIRVRLQNKSRLHLPCYLCDFNGGFRLGLLPKVGDPLPDDQISRLIIGNYQKYDYLCNKYASQQKFFDQDQNGIRAILGECE